MVSDVWFDVKNDAKSKIHGELGDCLNVDWRVVGRETSCIRVGGSGMTPLPARYEKEFVDVHSTWFYEKVVCIVLDPYGFLCSVCKWNR